MERQGSDDVRAVLVDIRAVVPSLRPSERRVAEQILNDPAAAAGRSIGELAELGRTSPTSVVRFYRRIGYQRYQDLRMDLARESTREGLRASKVSFVSADIGRDDSLADIIAKVSDNETRSIADTARTLDTTALAAAVSVLSSVRRIDIFGVGASSIVGLDLQQKLGRIGLTALGWSESNAALTAAAVLDENCLAIAVSHSGATADTVDFLRAARASGAATLAITNFDRSPLAMASSIVLTTAVREVKFRSAALGSRIAQLMVVDCLFTAVAQANYERSIAALRDTYAAVQGGKIT